MNEMQTDLIKRLRRAEGQVRGVQKLIEADSDCEKVVQQLAAARKALDKTFYKAIACALKQALDADEGQATDIEHYSELLTKYG